jgi:GNAT superfamily N-acetyltransferase
VTGRPATGGTGAPEPGLVIRVATAADAPAVADVYLASFRATYDFPLAHGDEAVRGWIAATIDGPAETWLAQDGAAVVGMMVVAPGVLDQLYVRPDRIGGGIGRRLLDRAKERSPAGLTLSTFQVNGRARRFYERNGFALDALGDGAGNEEGQADVRYVWRPIGGGAIGGGPADGGPDGGGPDGVA